MLHYEQFETDRLSNPFNYLTGGMRHCFLVSLALSSFFG